MKFLGFHDVSTLPIKKGDTVTIPKGTTIRTTLPNQTVKVAGRTYKVKVNYVCSGSNAWGEHHPAINPYIEWPGTGGCGYWHRVDINSLPEAQ